jgi:hypothetical protein
MSSRQPSGPVDILQSAADKVWSTTTRALTDKVGFALSSAGVQAMWDALTSALVTTGSIGKWIVDKLDVPFPAAIALHRLQWPRSALRLIAIQLS